jgi:hypothetical protein
MTAVFGNPLAFVKRVSLELVSLKGGGDGWGWFHRQQ